MKLPSIIALKDYIPHNHTPAFTRFNVFLRDDFTCQYCSEKFSTKELTFDHLIPRSKGGLTNWKMLSHLVLIVIGLKEVKAYLR